MIVLHFELCWFSLKALLVLCWFSRLGGANCSAAPRGACTKDYLEEEDGSALCWAESMKVIEGMLSPAATPGDVTVETKHGSPFGSSVRRKLGARESGELAGPKSSTFGSREFAQLGS